MTEEKQERIEDYLVGDYGIFRLTPREAGRLMNVDEKNIDKMLSVNSNTQCYKQFGNSIVVSVLIAIFSQLNICGCERWNELTDDERYKLIYKGCAVNE